MGWSVVRLGASLVHTLFGLTRRERTEQKRRGGNRKAPNGDRSNSSLEDGLKNVGLRTHTLANSEFGGRGRAGKTT